MKIRTASGLLAFTLLFLASVTLQPLGAQVLYGSLVGIVEDSSGAVIPNATISVTAARTGQVREVQADSQGRYTVPNLLPGAYEVRVSAAGFKSFIVKGVEVTVNTVSRTDARLEVGAIAEQITVEGAAVMLQTDKSDVRHEISGAVVQNLPLPAYRNYQSLMALVPGTTPPAFQNAVVDTPGRALRSFVNGTATNMNNTLVDGAVNVNIWLPHHVAYVQPVESIETVNITTGSMDAEQGMAGGAAVTVATKSGTNTLHGTGWWFHNNQRFNSDPVYFRPAGYRKPVANLNIFGGNLGGPIKKDKLFYFFNFERTTERTGQFSSVSVAPADFRQGDFSAWSQYSLIYDPATAPQNQSANRTPFPGNRIPASRISSIFANIYKDVPLPNQVSPTDPLNLSGNYGVGGTLKLNRNQYDTKINYNVSPNLVTWGKYSRMDSPVSGVYAFGDLGGPALGTHGFGDTTTQLVSGGYTHTISPNFLWDGVFGYTVMNQTVGIPNVDKNVGLDIWGIPGTNGGRQFANDPRYGGPPNLSGFGFSNVGIDATWAPLFRTERSYTYQSNFSKLSGAHELRWGFEARRMELNHWQPETSNPRGQISFAAGVTNIPAQQARTANSFAAALLGLVQSYGKSIQFFEMKTREWQYSLYFRDRWQVSRRLTLNLGLRYELYPLLNRGDRGLERWDPFTNIVTFGGLGGVPRENGMSVSRKMFAPRIGLAYRLTDTTVFRAGYGLNYDPLAFGRPLRGLYPATLTGSWVPTVANFGWFNTINEGIPDVPTPDVSRGSLTLPLNLDMGPRSPWGGQINRGYIQSWNATIERRLPWEMVSSVGYVATRTVHQLMDRNINSVGPGEGITTANLPLARLYGRTIASNMWDGIGKASYHSLQSTLDKRFTHGLLLRATYTFGKALNMADENGWTGMRNYNWEPMIYKNYSPAGYDRTHAFTAGWNYELPVGRGKRLNLDNTVANFVIGGWKLAGTFTAYSGTPFTVSGSGASLQATGNGQTADQIAPVRKIGGKGPGTFYYDPMSFRDPLWETSKTPGVYRFGTMGLNRLRGPGFWRLNPAIFKEFAVTEKFRAEFRAESTNFTNTPAWGNPNSGSGSLQLNADGSLNTNVADPYQNFMRITGASTGRDIRFGLRLSF